MQFKQIVDICRQAGFLVNANEHATYKVAPIGSVLLENLKNEWLASMVNNKESSIFYNTNNFEESYDFVRAVCSERLPFGLADVAVLHSPSAAAAVDENVNFLKYFKNYNHLRSTMFVAPSEATRFFQQWQRHRRMWWRKFSPTPGRYHTTDPQEIGGSQIVEIIAKYPWGEQVVEQLNLNSNGHSQLNASKLSNLFDKKRVRAHHVTSTIPISTIYLNTLCDAYEEFPWQDTKRILFRFHRKLAPYKISFAVSSANSTAATTNELGELAQYLCKKVRGSGIMTLLLPSCSRSSLEEQFKQYDHLGVPYTVVLKESTLTNGVAFLRSRDTTLKEQVHVSELPAYIELLFKNY